MGPPGDELGLSLDRLAYKDGYNDYMMLVLWLFVDNLQISCDFLGGFEEKAYFCGKVER